MNLDEINNEIEIVTESEEETMAKIWNQIHDLEERMDRRERLLKTGSDNVIFRNWESES